MVYFAQDTNPKEEIMGPEPTPFSVDFALHPGSSGHKKKKKKAKKKKKNAPKPGKN